MIEKIDAYIKSIFYRTTLHRDDVAAMMADIDKEWEPRREWTGALEVTDLLLDARVSHMTEGENDEQLSKEFDALVGSDIDSG